MRKSDRGSELMSTSGRIIAGIVLAPIVVLVLGIGGCEARKAYYDWQVRKMCEKDGGVTVYERFPVTSEFFIERGGDRGIISLPNESEERTGIPVFQRMTSLVLKEGSLKVSRHEAQVVRRSDSKILGRLVLYGRSGGDFPFTASSPSYYQCPEENNDVVRRVLAI